MSAIPWLMVAIVSQAIPAQRTPGLDAVAKAMGGKERILAVRTLIVEGDGEGLVFGQNHTPYAKTNFTVTALRRSYDFVNRRWRLDQTREMRYLTPMPPPLRVHIGIDGDVGYNVIGDGPMARTSSGVAVDRAAELIYHPVGFVQAAFAPGNRVEEDVDGREDRIRIRVGDISYAMGVDRRTHLPTRIRRVVDHLMLGDATYQVAVSDWREVSGLTLPMRIVQSQSRWVLASSRIRSTRINEDPGNLAATDSVRAAPPAGQEQGPINVTVTELAPGVWSLGAAYHTIAIEQSNRIVLIEAPENDAEALATIAKARELRPGKSLGPVVNTHHHFDHAGGVRAAISQGLPVITHEGNRDFYESVVYPGRHTIRPDALEKNPRPLSLTAVRGKLVLRDSLRVIELYEVAGSPHSGSMLMAYLPAERILIQADLDNPPRAGGSPFTPALVETVRRLGLRVDRVVGIHGDPMPWATN